MLDKISIGEAVYVDYPKHKFCKGFGRCIKAPDKDGVFHVQLPYGIFSINLEYAHKVYQAFREDQIDGKIVQIYSHCIYYVKRYHAT